MIPVRLKIPASYTKHKDNVTKTVKSFLTFTVSLFTYFSRRYNDVSAELHICGHLLQSVPRCISEPIQVQNQSPSRRKKQNMLNWKPHLFGIFHVTQINQGASQRQGKGISHSILASGKYHCSQGWGQLTEIQYLLWQRGEGWP